MMAGVDTFKGFPAEIAEADASAIPLRSLSRVASGIWTALSFVPDISLKLLWNSKTSVSHWCCWTSICTSRPRGHSVISIRDS